MPWLVLIVAAMLEIAWAIGLRYTDGFSKLGPTIPTVIALVASVLLLSHAAKTLPIGTAYAVWVGIGAAGTATLGILLFHDPANAGRIFFLLLLVVSVVGLKLTSSE